ncbi:MAG: DUF1223 domain-containing protein [Paracoccaceae bacterium]
MRQMVSAAGGLWLAMATTTQAEPVVVVELYTSQGCSSCPAADNYLETLIQDPRVMPLALHVDYWDYIGWKDTFGQAKFTERQKAYARAIGSRTIYTPQMIVGGRDRVEGNVPAEVAAHVAEQLAAGRRVMLVARREGGVVVITAEADPPLTEPVRVQLVRYKPEETVAIERGENAGQTITYRNIVTSWDNLGEWSGTAALDLEVPAEGSDGTVVILQEAGPSAILAAARVD